MDSDRNAGRKARLRAVPAAAPVDIPIRGRQRLALIRDLAIGEWDSRSLSRMYDLSPMAVEVFAAQHQEEVQEVALALEGTLDISTAGMWLSKKQQRLAEYQQAIDDIDEELNALRDSGVTWSRAHRDMFRARLDLYRQAADELGAYPQRASAPARQGLGVQYIIDSEDAKDMK